jgi:hypothetical protein
MNALYLELAERIRGEMNRAFARRASGFIGSHLAKELKAVTRTATLVRRRWMAPADQEPEEILIG